MGTIKSSREIDSIFRGAKRAAHPLMILLVRETPEGRGHSGRVAFVAGKKLGNAVKRNRSKRILRETVRRAGGPWAGFDVVLISRPTTRSAAPDELGRALAASLKNAGVRE